MAGVSTVSSQRTMSRSRGSDGTSYVLVCVVIELSRHPKYPSAAGEIATTHEDVRQRIPPARQDAKRGKDHL